MILTMNKNFLCGRNLSLTVAMMLLLLLPLALCTFYSSNRRHYTPKWLHHKVLRRVAPHLRERRDYYYEHTNSSLESNYSTVSSSSLFCEQQGCKRQGELCKGSFSNVDGCIEDCCAYGLECVQTAYGERRCNYNTLDMNCSLDSSLCMRGERCSINGSCVGMYAPGDGCLSDDDCILATNCSNSNHTCVGLQEGAACSPYSYECAYGLYCSPKTSVCTTQQSSGQSCDSPNACEWLHVCVEGSCRRLWTQSAGQPCIPDDWDYSNCDFGLECINGNCSHPQHEASVPCVHNSDCSHGEPCLCNEFLGGFYCDRPLYTDNCVSQFKSMLACAEEHECIIEDQSFLPNSCFRKHCKSEAQAVSICFCPEIKSQIGDCIYFEMGGSCESSSITNTDKNEPSSSQDHYTTTSSDYAGNTFIGLAFALMFIIVGSIERDHPFL